MAVVLVGVLVGLVLAAPPAAAHAYVVATTPANGAQVSTPPTRIRVTFDEPVTLPSAQGSAAVIDSTGTPVDDGTVALVDGRRTLVVGVRPGLATGTYIASWAVVSADTHPIGGSIQFGYGVPAVAVEAPAAAAPSAVLQLFVGIVTGLLSLSLVAAFGLVPAALVLGAEPAERRTVWHAARLGAGLALVASLLQIVAQYLWDASAVTGGPGWSGLRTFAGSGYSAVVLLRVGLLAAALVALPPLRVVAAGSGRLRAWWAADAVLAVAVLGTVVRNGHAGAGPWWHFGATLVHVCAVVAWLGGLVVLGGLVLRRRLSVRRLRRLPLWSRYAATSVALLALTGLLQGLVEVRYPTALVSTTYGAILVVKLVLVAVALLLGLLGNRWISRRIAEADGDAGDGLVVPGRTARLRGRVRAEAGIGGVIVIISGVLSSVAPAATAYAPTRVMTTTIGPYAVTIQVAPARRGPESFRITSRGATDATPPTRSVQLGLRQAGGVTALPVSFPYRLPGAIRAGEATSFTFVSSSVSVPGTGTWTGTLTLVAGETEQYTAEFTYPVL